MDVSVVIPAFNRPEALEQTLQGLAGQPMAAERFEVLVVDDGSTDEGLQALAHRPWPYALQLLRQPRSGPGAARNRGVQESHGDLLVFLDADMIPSSNLLEAYHQAYVQDPRAVFVGRQLAWPESFTSPFDRVFGYASIGELGPEPVPIEFHCLASGNFALPRAVLDSLGGFDPELQMTEDTDLAYRAHQQGLQFRYVPAAVGYHNHPKTLRELCAQHRSSARWTARLLRKHPGLYGRLSNYREIEPIRLGRDPARLVLRKAGRRMLATPPAQALLEAAASLFERILPVPALLRSLYFKILTGQRLQGFRQGLAELQRQATGGD